MKGQRIQEGSRIVFSEVLTLSGVVRLFNNLFWYSTLYSVCVRNGFRRATEYVPHAYGMHSAPYAEYMDGISSHS